MKDKNTDDQLLGANISFALEMDQAFKLFSYRIINRDEFNKRVQTLSDAREFSKKKLNFSERSMTTTTGGDQVDLEDSIKEMTQNQVNSINNAN